MSRHEYRRLGWCRGCGLLVATLVIMATYSMEPPVYEGTITLYVDGDRRTLVMDDTWASFNAQATPQR